MMNEARKRESSIHGKLSFFRRWQQNSDDTIRLRAPPGRVPLDEASTLSGEVLRSRIETKSFLLFVRERPIGKGHVHDQELDVLLEMRNVASGVVRSLRMSRKPREIARRRLACDRDQLHRTAQARSETGVLPWPITRAQSNCVSARSTSSPGGCSFDNATRSPSAVLASCGSLSARRTRAGSTVFRYAAAYHGGLFICVGRCPRTYSTSRCDRLSRPLSASGIA